MTPDPSPREIDASVAALQRLLAPDDGAIECPAHEQIEAYVDDALDAGTRAMVDAHLVSCAICREDVDDLRELAVPIRRRGDHRITYAAGAAIAAAAAAAAWFVLGGVLPGLSAPGSAPVATTPPPVAVPYDETIATAVRTGILPLPADIRELRGQMGVLMAPAAVVSQFRVVRPVGTAVRGSRPTFEWTAAEAGATYTVSVFTEDLEKVAEGVVRATTWSPAALPAGERYLWQVRARSAGRELLTPQPPLPEARFRTLSDEEALQIAADEAKYAGSPLARAIVYARAGLVDEARMALQAAAAGPDSEAVRRLQASLAAVDPPPRIRPQPR